MDVCVCVYNKKSVLEKKKNVSRCYWLAAPASVCSWESREARAIILSEPKSADPRLLSLAAMLQWRRFSAAQCEASIFETPGGYYILRVLSGNY